MQIINPILFSFTLFFGVHSPIVSKQTLILIDQSLKTIELEYRTIETKSSFVEETNVILRNIEKLTEVDASFDGLKLMKLFKVLC